MTVEAPLVIVGGGLAGTLAALVLAERRPDLPLVLVESGERLGGNHVWSFFDSDLEAQEQELVGLLKPVRWRGHAVAFPRRERRLGFGYNSVTSEALDALGRKRLGSRLRLGCKVERIEPDAITVDGGERIAARAVIDARGPDGPMPGLVLAWQKFVGIELGGQPHDLAEPIIMDGKVEQLDGYRFVYSLPFDGERVFVEDTYYSDGAELDVGAIRQRILDYARARGWHGKAGREETGLLPVLLDGDPDVFWPAGDPVPRLGVRGGFFHPTTGYSLPLAARNALALADLGDFTAPALARWTRARFLAHWRGGRFFRALDRMLFRAARPEERVRVFEHFYRLPEPVIARFYAGRLTLADKARILTGVPPVPVGRALKALFA